MNTKSLTLKMSPKRKAEANKLANKIVKDYGPVIKKLANT